MPTASDRSRLISIVQSRQNARVRELRAAFARSSSREGAIAIEGENLIREALRSELRIRTVFLRRELDRRGEPERRESAMRMLDRLGLAASIPVVELTPPVFDSTVETESPQGIAALVEPPNFTLSEILAGSKGTEPLLVITASLQDPGNLGTLVRSAEAFAATGVIALPGTVSIWNAKALRASAGAAFRLPVLQERSAAAFAAMAERQIPVYAAVPAGGDEAIPCSSCDLTRPAAILIGNEGSGLSAELLDQADARIAIPMPGPSESLNAAVAASILLYEAARQRTARD